VIVHTLPTNDAYPHEESLLCACGPRAEALGEGVTQVIHNSWDQRELFEVVAALAGLDTPEGTKPV